MVGDASSTTTATTTFVVVGVGDDSVEWGEGYFGAPRLPPPLDDAVPSVVVAQLPQQRDAWSDHLRVVQRPHRHAVDGVSRGNLASDRAWEW